MSSSEEPVGERSELPLAARNALVHLLVRDLAGDRPEGAVHCALLLLDSSRTSASQEVADARSALRAAGVLTSAPVAVAGNPPGGPPPPWAAVVRARLDAYARVLAEAPRGTELVARLVQSRRMFAHSLYFEVHEVLEPAWRKASGAERTILQGIIQAAVAWHHATRRNHGAALRLARASHAKLARAPVTWQGFPLGGLRASLEVFADSCAVGDAIVPPRLAWAEKDRGT